MHFEVLNYENLISILEIVLFDVNTKENTKNLTTWLTLEVASKVFNEFRQ